jgi:hypothetical protein
LHPATTPGAKIFTAEDASDMYTNIDATLGLNTIHEILSTYESIPTNFPKEFFLLVLETIMNNNIFSFGDTYWLQINGTPMGTPAAPLYSIITFGHHENTSILQIIITKI